MSLYFNDYLVGFLISQDIEASGRFFVILLSIILVIVTTTTTTKHRHHHHQHHRHHNHYVSPAGRNEWKIIEVINQVNAQRASLVTSYMKTH